MLRFAPRHPKEPDSKPKDLYVGQIFSEKRISIHVYTNTYVDVYSMGMNKMHPSH